MDAFSGSVRTFRGLRILLLVLLAAWFFSPPSIRDAIPLWLPFAVALGLELQFVAANYRSTAPFFRPDDRQPDAADRERYGDGAVPEWAIVDAPGGPVWVDLTATEETEDAGSAAPTTRPSRPRSPARRLARPVAEAAAVLAVVAAIVLLLDRGGWGDLDAATQRTAEARISAEASTIAGKSVRVGCDTSGRRVGAVQHADGVAIVGGNQAYLTPSLCFAIHRLADAGEVASFSETGRAIAVLAHEAWHLRGERDEGIVECYAVQSGVGVARRLGLDEDTARRMMRSQLVANQLHRQGSAEYLVPAECVNRGDLDLAPTVDRFP
jgi:hypothetical protein